MKNVSIEKNLTEGSVAKQLILFALPFMLSNLIQTLYNVTDMLIVGIYSGTVGISGVNIGGQVTFILTNIIIGLAVGGTVVIGQYLGAGDRKGMRETISTLLTFLLVAGIAFTVIMLILSDKVLNLLQTPKESYQQARNYLDVTLMGTIFIFGYNAFAAILRGLGDSKRPLIFVTMIMQNSKIGGRQLIEELKKMTYETWEMRKHAVKQLGETASAKLIFPLMLMFFAVLLIVITPAIMQFSKGF
jgi:Na+-driven multidrug efflux pump